MQSNINKLPIIITLIIFVLNHHGLAHVGEHEYIELLTIQIKENPENPDLYFKRGVQHRLSSHFEQSLSDFITVEQIEGDYHHVDLAIGQLFMDFEWYITAEFYLKRFLTNEPNNVVALTYFARSLSAQGKGDEASEIYVKLLGLVPKPSPDFFVEMADAYLLENNYSEALKTLDEGIEILGHITSLQSKAIEIEIANKNYPGALIRLDNIIENSPQTEKWMLKKGLLYETLGKYNEAFLIYTKALNHLNSRPPNKRSIPVFTELSMHINKALDRVSQKL